MKKYYLIIVLGLFSLSCEEDFNPFGEFKEKYIFNCILRGDSVFQAAALSRSYNPTNFNPSDIIEDVSIVGADVRIFMGDSAYVFSDSAITRIDTSVYKKPFRFYFNNYLNLQPNQEIQAEIILPSGMRLKSFSKTPQNVQFDQQNPNVISSESLSLLQFNWNSSFSGQYFSPRLIFKYSVNISDAVEVRIKEIPLKYISEDNVSIPVYPQIGNQPSISIEKHAIQKALNEISAGDPNKQNYTIYEFAVVQVLSFDQNLSRYFSITSSSLDDLTARIDEKDFTNIEGGYGIFASYIKSEYKLKFFVPYIQSFGYKVLVGN